MLHIAETRQRFGWRAAGHTLAYKCLQRCLVLDVTHLMLLDVCRLPPIHTPSAACRPLSEEEVTPFSYDPELALDSSIIQRLRGNLDFCIGAIIDNQLACYYWLALDSIEAIHNSAGCEDTGVAMSYPANMIFAYKAFVHPRFRGQGLYAELAHAAANWAHENLCIRFIISTADWTNHSALRSCGRQGKCSLGRIWRFGLPGRMFTMGPGRAADHGIKLGRQARIKGRFLGGSESQVACQCRRDGLPFEFTRQRRKPAGPIS